LKLFVNPYTGIPLYVQVAEQVRKAVTQMQNAIQVLKNW